MHFGFSLSNNQGIEDVQAIVRLATRAEALGVSPADIVHNIQAFASLGVERVVIAPSTGDVQAMMQALEMIAREVMPACT